MADIRDIFGEGGVTPQQKRPTERNSTSDLRSALQAKGLLVSDIVLNGNVQRVPTRDKPHSLTAGILAHNDTDGNFVCSFGDWREKDKNFFLVVYGQAKRKRIC